MRIRKNAKLSPLLFSSSSSQGGSVPVETFQTHVCQLNQSPWDVIPFDSDSIQFQCEDSFTAGNNGSAGDSFGAVESVASMMDTEEKPKIEADDNHDKQQQHGKKVGIHINGYKGVARNSSCCKALDGKGWPCKNAAKQGQSFCHHHLSLVRSFDSNGGDIGCNKKTPAAPAAATTARRARARAAKKPPSSNPSNPTEFYYYCGFGPRWGKRRGDRNGEASRNSNGGVEDSAMVESDSVVAATAAATGNVAPNNMSQSVVVPSSSSLQIDNEGLDFVDDEEEEETEDDSGKRRTRKPVKARSLKSLM